MTVNGLKNTIRCDEEVFRWAIALLSTPNISKTLSYKKMRVLKSAHILVMAANLLAVWSIFKILTPSFSLVRVLAALCIILAVYLLEIPYKNMAASLTKEFIEGNFSADELKKWTLLQLSVRLEEKYGVAPIVDMLSGWTKFFRMAFIAVYIAVTWVLFLNFSTRIGLLLCGAWALRALSRSSLLRPLFKI